MIRLRLLGGPDLVGPDDRSIPSVLEQPKRLALLAYLALASPSAFRSRDALLALFWPESDQEHARRALNQALHFLRRHIGTGVIVTRGSSEVGTVADALWCDAVAFEQALLNRDAARALDLYRGDLLPAFFVDGAPEFERWLDEQRIHFRHRARRAAWSLAESAERRGELGAATEWARRSIALSPNDETALQDLLRLLDRIGDRAGALHAYQSFTARLAEEFDAQPSAETQRLIAAIRSRAESPRAESYIAFRDIRGSVREPPHPSIAADDEIPAARAMTADEATTANDGERVRRGVRLRRLAAVAIGACVIGGYWGFTHLPRARDRRSMSFPAAHIDVETFSDLTAPPGPTMLGPAITTAVIDQLAAVRSFEVTSGMPPTPRREGDTTRSHAPRLLVTGSVLQAGGRVRVGVELTDPTSGRTVRTAVLMHDSSAAIPLLDTLANEIASLVRVAAGREVRFRSWSASARNATARARIEQASVERDRAHELERGGELPTAARALANADSLLGEAEAIAPGWREALIERARVLGERAMLHLAPAFRDTVRAEALLAEGAMEATRAVALDRDDAAALEALGQLSYWDWLIAPAAPDSAERLLAQARRNLQRAVAADPDRASAWSLLSAVLYGQADFSGAYLAADRAYRADAYLDAAQEILNRLFVTAYEIGDDSASTRWCQEIGRRFPRSWTRAYCKLSLLAWNGDHPVDRRAVQEAWMIAGAGSRPGPVAREMEPRLHMLVAAVLARAGLRDSAEAVIERARGHADHDPELLPLEASARIPLRQPDVATDLLARYVQGKPSHRAAIVCTRRFDSLGDLARRLAWPRPCRARGRATESPTSDERASYPPRTTESSRSGRR
ncbi:MAG TPA: BTAD domain-containing putative transcriptional regulator [Gemmatimonadaceae bacterium]